MSCSLIFLCSAVKLLSMDRKWMTQQNASSDPAFSDMTNRLLLPCFHACLCARYVPEHAHTHTRMKRKHQQAGTKISLENISIWLQKWNFNSCRCRQLLREVLPTDIKNPPDVDNHENVTHTHTITSTTPQQDISQAKSACYLERNESSRHWE